LILSVINNGHIGEIYNIGSGQSQSINEIIHKIATYLGKDVTINYQPRNCFDVDKTKADISRMSSSFSWYPKVSFDDCLKEQIEWQKEQYKSELMAKSLREASESLNKAFKK